MIQNPPETRPIRTESPSQFRLALLATVLLFGLVGLIGLVAAQFFITSPESARAREYAILGDEAVTAGDDAGAIAWYTQSIEVEAEASVYVKRGQAYARQGDFEAALADYLAARDIAPDNPPRGLDDLIATAESRIAGD